MNSVSFKIHYIYYLFFLAEHFPEYSKNLKPHKISICQDQKSSKPPPKLNKATKLIKFLKYC